MSHRVKVVVGVLLASVLLVGLSVVDQFFYPFTASPPYFSEVEKVFDRIQIPADWKEISSSENRGIAGKRCPIESDGCFHKGKRFLIPFDTTDEKIKDVFKTSNCPVVSISNYEQIGGDPYSNVICVAPNASEVSGTLERKTGGWEMSVYVSKSRS